MQLLPNFGPGQFRILLAALVVLSHMSSFEIGRPAVFAFFMLSGYWVLRMYDEKYRVHASITVFYVSRFMRIWLPFATAFLAVYATYAVLNNPKPLLILSGLPILGIASTSQDVLGTSWSLDIELQFYLLVPAISILLMWVRQDPVRLFGLGLVTMVLTVFGWYVQTRFDFWTVLSYMPPFLIGALIWHLRLKSSRLLAAMSLIAFALIGLGVALSPDLAPLLSRTTPSPFNEDWFGMLWVSVLTPFIIWNVQQKSGRFDMHLGNYAYALYITHWPVIDMMRKSLSPLSLLDRALILGAIIVVSFVFYVLVDRTWENLRRKLTSSMSESAL